jgi:hypothetical protein
MKKLDCLFCPDRGAIRQPLPSFPIGCLLLLFALVEATNAAWPLDSRSCLPICTAADDQETPRIIPDGDGGVIICWTDRRLGYPRLGVYAQRVNASGVALWQSNGVSLYLPGKEQAGPLATSDGAGGAIVFYLQSPGVDQFPDLYAQHIDASGTLRWDSNGVLVSSAPYGQYHSAAIGDGSGGAIVAWADGRNSSFQVYVQRLSANGEPLWAANGQALTSDNIGVANFIHMVPDGAGGAILAWDDSRNYFGDIFAQRIDAQGRAQWASNGVPVSPLPWEQSFPSLVADGAGGAIVCWQDDRTGEADLYAQRVGPDGAQIWAAEGVPVCTAPGMQSDAAIVADGAGGALIAWTDFRNVAESSGDLYCQRLNEAGLAQWASNGVAVCTAPGYQFGAAMVSDTAGGAIIAWGDQRNGPNDIFAQQIDAAGVPRWAPQGIPVCSAPDDQNYPAIASDQAGGAIVVWPDRRNGSNYDIYANRLSPPVASAGGDYRGTRGEPVAFSSAGSSDPAGDPLTFGWDFGDGSTATGTAPAHAYAADGVYKAVLWVSDGLIAVSDTATVTIKTENPPDCSRARAVPAQIWPPDRRLVPITITGVSDPDGESVTIRVTRVTQDEPLAGRGAQASAIICPDGSVALRAERLGQGNGRVYRIRFTATDSTGASSEGSVRVCVPHDKSRPACIDDGQNFDSLWVR